MQNEHIEKDEHEENEISLARIITAGILLVAAEILEKVCKDRKIIPIYARDIIVGGGNIHCITQQIPFTDKGGKI